MALDQDADVSHQINELVGLAAGLVDAGRLDEAEEILLTLEPLAPSPDIRRALGLIDARKGAWSTARPRLEAAAAAQPQDAEVLNALAACHVHGGDHASALRLADAALALGASEAFNNRGAALSGLERLEEACAAFRMAHEHDSADAAVLVNLAGALQGLGRSAEALDIAGRAAVMAPDLAEAHVVRGTALHSLERYVEAEAGYSRALALDPGLALIQIQRGHCRLALGRFLEGWRDHEARWRIPGAMGPGRDLRAPRWAGEDLRGRTLLVHCEQGMGDSIQFARYVPLLAERGAAVVLEAFQALAPLLQEMDGVAQVITRRDPLPPVDLHCPIMSLPLVLGLDQAYAPEAPYLRAPADALVRWRAQPPAAGALKIGVVASGNPTQVNDSRRSIPLADLTQALPSGPSYVLLQKEVREDDRPALAARPDIAFIGERFHDFGDTAAACQMLDLIVSVDTGVAHLAGALGRPVWILARSPPDWRYARHPTRTAWYPSATVYRQERPGDWPGVLSRVERDLAALAAARGQTQQAEPLSS